MLGHDEKDQAEKVIIRTILRDRNPRIESLKWCFSTVALAVLDDRFQPEKSESKQELFKQPCLRVQLCMFFMLIFKGPRSLSCI